MEKLKNSLRWEQESARQALAEIIRKVEEKRTEKPILNRPERTYACPRC